MRISFFPYLDGETLEARLRRGPASVADTLTVARGILAGLAEAHRHGVLHRDVKPANVVVGGGAAIGQVTLITDLLRSPTATR